MPTTHAGFGPARRRVLSDDVTDQIRDAIVTGQLEPGKRLREDELSTQMEVSRGPVREAFVTLEREGLVIIERYKGARVAEFYREDLEQVFSLRQVLETLATEWACRNATEADLDALDAVLDQFMSLPADQRTPAHIAETDILFHDRLVQAAHHERLERAWDSLRSQISAFLRTRMSLRKDYYRVWEPDHRRIVELLRARDTEAAVAHVKGHLNSSYARVVDAMDKRE